MTAPVLEDFGSAVLKAQVAEDQMSLAEDLRLEAFEQGYANGWDDATQAGADNMRAASDAFVQSLQDLSFTYHEVGVHAARALEPLLTAICQTLLPDALEDGLHIRIAEQLMTAAQGAQTIVEVRCSPFRKSSLAQMLPSDLPVPVTIVSDESFGQDDVVLGFGAREQQIDLTAIRDAIKDAIAAYNFQVQRELTNG